MNNKNNPCRNAWDDWLDVFITSKCNGKCKWCIAKNKKDIDECNVGLIVKTCIALKKKNIIITGGEPTLHPKINELIDVLFYNDINVHLNTNGSMLDSVSKSIKKLKTLNISLHHFDLNINKKITGVDAQLDQIRVAVNLGIWTQICVTACKDGITDTKDAYRMIDFVKEIGINNLKFSEIQKHENDFVSIPEIFNYEFGLTENPWEDGCRKTAEINGVNVSFTLKCGRCTKNREIIELDELSEIIGIVNQRPVLYGDGRLSNGYE